MSHFVGLVIMTPQYAENHSIEDALDKYDENKEVSEYSKGEVSDYSKVEIVDYYKHGGFHTLLDALHEKLVKDGVIEPFDKDKHRTKFLQMTDALKEEGFEKAYIEFFNETYPGMFSEFDKIYAENGKDWNGNAYRINPLTGKWEEYSTYNKDSKWDWYSVGGRWDCAIKTKDKEFVNECLLGEIDWTDFTDKDYLKKKKNIWGKEYRALKKNVRWHFTKSETPFCLIIDGQWIEEGEMGWRACVSNEKEDVDWNAKVMEVLSRLPENSEVTLVDFHI